MLFFSMHGTTNNISVFVSFNFIHIISILLHKRNTPDAFYIPEAIFIANHKDKQQDLYQPLMNKILHCIHMQNKVRDMEKCAEE